MSALFVVLPLAVLISALAVGAFLWATRHGQLDDLDTPALRMLHDDDAPGSQAAPAPRSPRKLARATPGSMQAKMGHHAEPNGSA